MTTKAKVNERDLSLAKHLQVVRKSRGLTQEEVCEKLGVSLTYYGYLEMGYKIPNLHMLQNIADILNVKVKDLIPF